MAPVVFAWLSVSLNGFCSGHVWGHPGLLFGGILLRLGSLLSLLVSTFLCPSSTFRDVDPGYSSESLFPEHLFRFFFCGPGH